MIKNYVMITDKIIREINSNNEYAFYDKEDCEYVCNLLNTKDKEISRLKKENEQLKQKINGLESELSIWKEDANEHIREMNELFEENKQLKQELFESKKDYIIETYSNNPIRRDKKLQVLKEEFKERFGDLTYITSDELLFNIINEAIENGDSE